MFLGASRAIHSEQYCIQQGASSHIGWLWLYHFHGVCLKYVPASRRLQWEGAANRVVVLCLFPTIIGHEWCAEYG